MSIETEDELAALRASLVFERPRLADRIREQIRRASKLRSSARISGDGASGAIETWENDVALMLEDIGREDLAARFEAPALSEKMKALVSGPWSTRARVNRKLDLLSQFVAQVEAGEAAPNPATDKSLGSL
jgi:hypothetical protein